MKKRIIFAILCVMLTFFAIPITASADMGPKPSVTVTFENIGDEICYGTLLSKNEHCGPYGIWNGNEENIYTEGTDIEIWRKFVDYKDADGFCYLQATWRVDIDKQIDWTYYPPSTFKILLYYPEKDLFIVSGIYEEYAFKTYYTVDMSGINIESLDKASPNVLLEAVKSYDYRQEIISFFVRMVLTVLIEVGIALLFGFVGKNELLIITAVNAATQIGLNVMLSLIGYKSGQLAFIASYIELELLVFLAEAVIFCILLRKKSEKKRKRWVYVLYALVSNAVSFGLGMAISEIIPNVF